MKSWASIARRAQATSRAPIGKLAKKLHPDANKNDPKAATRFAELNAAHELLGDEDKRKAFDRGEIDAEGKPRFQGFGGGSARRGPGGGPGGGFGPDANFESFNFGPEGFTRGRAARRAGGGGGFGGFEDILKEAFGARRRAAAPERLSSRRISASAPTCRPTMTVTLPEAANGVTAAAAPAERQGCRRQDSCRHHQWPDRSGSRARAWPGRPAPGDVLITVSIAPHPVFTLEGADVRLDLPITLYEAALGAKVRVPTLDKPVEITIPPWTSSGRTFRLKGKGFPAKAGRGDLLATVRIVLPDKSDAELEALMKKWQDDKPYDPRKDM